MTTEIHPKKVSTIIPAPIYPPSQSLMPRPQTPTDDDSSSSPRRPSQFSPPPLPTSQMYSWLPEDLCEQKVMNNSSNNKVTPVDHQLDMRYYQKLMRENQLQQWVDEDLFHDIRNEWQQVFKQQLAEDNLGSSLESATD